MRKLLSAGLAALLLIAPAAVWSATVSSPWSRTIDGVSEGANNVTIASDSATFYVVGTINDDLQINTLNGTTGADNWSNAVDGGAGLTDAGRAANAEWVRPVAAGSLQTSAGVSQAHARRYNVVTGASICSFTTPLAGLAGNGSQFEALAQTPGAIIAGGRADSTNTSWLVQALTTNCTSAWVDTIAGLSLSPGAQAASVAANIFGVSAAAGWSNNAAAPGNAVWTVRTYNSNGTVRWTKKTATAGRDNFARSIAIDGSSAFVAGDIKQATSGNERAVIKVYDLVTGALKWQATDKPLGYGRSAYKALALDGNLVVGVGYARKAATLRDWLITAHNAATGAVVWQALVDNIGQDDEALAVAIAGDYVAVVGKLRQGPAQDRYHVRIYHRNGDGLGGPLLIHQDTPLAENSSATGVAGQTFVPDPINFPNVVHVRFAATGFQTSGDDSQALTKAYLITP